MLNPCEPDLQSTYSNYKNTLQQIAQKIGDIEQEAEEHKYVAPQPSTTGLMTILAWQCRLETSHFYTMDANLLETGWF